MRPADPNDEPNFNDDPDRDFPERDENYLHEVMKRLHDLHSDTQILQINARTQLARAEEEERDLWLEFEDYLTEAALWHQKKTGESQLRTPHGILNIFEQSGRVQVDDIDMLQEWTQSHLRAVLPLATAVTRFAPPKPPRQKSLGSTSPLPPSPAMPRPPVPKPSPESPASPTKIIVTKQVNLDSEDPTPYDPALHDPDYPWEEKGVDRSFVGASRYEIEPLLAAIWDFHRATGILPAGCRMGPSRTVVRLG